MKTTPENHPTHEQIAIHARFTWELRGQPEGLDEEIWLTAEQDLRNDRQLNVAVSENRVAALDHLVLRSDAVQKELSELFPSKDSRTLLDELQPSSLNEER